MPFRTTRSTCLLMLILGLGLLLRLWGIGFGLPDLYHYDEIIDYYNVISAVSQGGHLASYVGASLPYFFLPIYGAAYLVSRVAGVTDAPISFLALIMGDPTWVVLPSRVALAMLSTATIWLTYRAGCDLFGTRAHAGTATRVGLVAALLLAVAPLAVQDAHYARGHTAAAFFILLTLSFSYRIARAPMLRWYLLAGASVGLASLMEYYAPAAIVLPLTAHVLRVWEARRGRSPMPLRQRLAPLLYFGAVAVVFAVGTPYAVLDVAGYIDWMRWYVRINAGTWVDSEGLPVLLFYLTEHLWHGLGGITLILGLTGLVRMTWRRMRADVLLIVFCGVFFIVLARSPNFARYAVPMLPFLSLAAGVLFDGMWGLPGRWQKALAVPVAAGLLVAVVSGVADSLRFDTFVTLPDTRTQAREWIEQNVPAEATIVVEGGHVSGLLGVVAPSLRMSDAYVRQQEQIDRAPIRSLVLRAMRMAAKRPTGYRVVFLMRLEELGAADNLRQFPYVVTSSWAAARGSRDPAFSRMLEEEYTLLLESRPTVELRFDPHAWRLDYEGLRRVALIGTSQTGGPVIRVYQRK